MNHVRLRAVPNTDPRGVINTSGMPADRYLLVMWRINTSDGEAITNWYAFRDYEIGTYRDVFYTAGAELDAVVVYSMNGRILPGTLSSALGGLGHEDIIRAGQ
jgi:hypothetical protein